MGISSYIMRIIDHWYGHTSLPWGNEASMYMSACIICVWKYEFCIYTTIGTISRLIKKHYNPKYLRCCYYYLSLKSLAYTSTTNTTSQAYGEVSRFSKIFECFSSSQCLLNNILLGLRWYCCQIKKYVSISTMKFQKNWKSFFVSFQV